MRNIPSLKRRSSTIIPRVEIVIACEGKNTEPEYLKKCISHYSAGLVRLRVLPQRGEPIAIVEAAINEKKDLIQKARKSKDSFDYCFRVWAIFDRDDHESYNEAILLAKKNKIDLAISNPCFELWPLLHLSNSANQDDRHQVQRRLNQIMPNYHHERGAYIDFDLIKDHFDVAHSRADQINKNCLNSGDEYGRPSTTFHKLVKKIIENGKK